MSTSEPQPRVRPSAWWYALPLVIWLACVVLVVVAFKPFFDIVSAGIDPVRNGDQVTVPDAGLTVYARGERPAGGCTLVDSAGSAIAMSSFHSHVTIDPPDEPVYVAVASTPDDVAAGTYVLRCRGAGHLDTLGTGERLDIGAIGKRLVLGVLGPLALAFVGLVVFIVLLVRRHQSKSAIRTQRAAALSGYPGTWSHGGGGYPPPLPPPPPPPPS